MLQHRYLLMVVLAVATVAAARESQAQAVAGDPQGTWTCYYRFTCTMDGVPIDYVRIPGEGQTEEEAYEAALEFATELRDNCVSVGHTASDPVKDLPCTPPGPEPGPGPIPDPMDPSFAGPNALEQSATQLLEFVEHRAITKQGNPRGAISYGKQAQTNEVSAAAWNQLLKRAAADGGMAPGTLRTRRGLVYTFVAFQVVRSVDEDRKIHREYVIIGRDSRSPIHAEDACRRAVANTITELSRLGESARREGPIRRKSVLASNQTMEHCIYKCRTRNKWTVIASDYGLTEAIACLRAEELARQISNEYGGPRKCAKIAPQDQP